MIIHTKWNLGLLYRSPEDPKIEKDMRILENAHEVFEKKYKGRDTYLRSESALFAALTEYERLVTVAGTAKPLVYFYLLKDIDSENSKAQAALSALSQRLTAAGNRIIFFTLAIGKIPEKKQKVFLKSKKLAPYRQMLKRVFETAKYQKSEAEEKILSLKSLPAHEMWVEGFGKVLSKQIVRFKKEELPFAEAVNRVQTLPVTDRRKLSDTIMEKLRTISDFAESEINAVYVDKKINDELRGFTKPYSNTLLADDTSEKMVMNLVDTVSKNFTISHRFYALKAKLLKLDRLEYADRSAPIGKTRKEIPFEEGLDTVRTAFGRLDGPYQSILDTYLKNGQIDVFPHKGKTGGAYCWGNLNAPTFVLLNHIPDLNSIMTLAHEMGHAIHTELSKNQPILYRSYSTAVAEVASTLFENFAYDELFEKLSVKEKTVMLHDKINGDISTIFRQVACFNFELELHSIIREKGAASREEIAALMNKHMGAYMGPAMKLKENDGYYYVAWSHIRRFFYVYSYAYGQLISKALYRMYKKDPSNLKKIEQFLKAGSSKSPEDIFKDLGIDTSKPDIFIEGLKAIEDDIHLLKKLTSKK